MRPSISPALLATMIEAVPGRLIRKLDKTPDLAEGWQWTADGDIVLIQTPKEPQVRLRGAVLNEAEQVSCTCLLSPKCLHIIAVLTRLPLASDSDAPQDSAEPVEPEAAPAERLELSDAQLSAAALVAAAATNVLARGVFQAGAVPQSSLLAAIHGARVEKLPRLAASSTRLMSALRRAREGGPLQPVTDALAETLHVGRALATIDADTSMCGVSRRTYREVGTLKLLGLATSRVSGGHGYSGCVTVLIDPTDMSWATLSTVRPDDMGGPRTAYSQGTGIGEVSAPHSELCRARLTVQSATRSDDGRLGTGRSVRAVLGGPLTLHDRRFDGVFARPIEDQVAEAVALLDIPNLQRRAGADILTFDALVSAPSDDGVWLELPNQLLVHALTPSLRAFCGMELRFVARLRADLPRSVEVVSIASPDLVLSESQHGRLMIELDPVTASMSGRPVPDTPPYHPPPVPEPWRRLHQLVERAVAGGWRSLPPQAESEVARQAALLRADGLASAGARHLALWRSAQAKVGKAQPDTEVFARQWTGAQRYLAALRNALVLESWSVGT